MVNSRRHVSQKIQRHNREEPCQGLVQFTDVGICVMVSHCSPGREHDSGQVHQLVQQQGAMSPVSHQQALDICHICQAMMRAPLSPPSEPRGAKASGDSSHHPPSQRWRVSVLLGRPGPNAHTDRTLTPSRPHTPTLTPCAFLPHLTLLICCVFLRVYLLLTVSSAAAAAAAAQLCPHPTSPVRVFGGSGPWGWGRWRGSTSCFAGELWQN
ncbi:hypothetical protein INR49_013895 [Caranx melampygus]|nr:hypothetical protein INR49_013895 [Caranx melampygus]